MTSTPPSENDNGDDDIKAEIAAGLMECRIAVESVAIADKIDTVFGFKNLAGA